MITQFTNNIICWYDLWFDCSGCGVRETLLENDRSEGTVGIAEAETNCSRTMASIRKLYEL
jgi:hypothetical protein